MKSDLIDIAVEVHHETGKPDRKISGWCRWVENNARVELSSFHATAVDILCLAFGSPWNVPWTWRQENFSGHCVSVCANVAIATTDRDILTRLVLAAHDYCARVSLRAAGRTIRISVYPRDRSTSIMSGHPTIEEAIARFRPASAETVS